MKMQNLIAVFLLLFAGIAFDVKADTIHGHVYNREKKELGNVVVRAWVGAIVVAECTTNWTEDKDNRLGPGEYLLDISGDFDAVDTVTYTYLGDNKNRARMFPGKSGKLARKNQEISVILFLVEDAFETAPQDPLNLVAQLNALKECFLRESARREPRKDILESYRVAYFEIVKRVVDIYERIDSRVIRTELKTTVAQMDEMFGVRR